MKNIVKIVSGGGVALLPFMALAQAPLGTDVSSLVTGIIDYILRPVTILIIGIGVVMFLWGLVQYITKGGEGSKEAVSLIFWGVVILFVMISVWGLVGILTGTFDLTSVIPNPPALRSGSPAY